MFLMRPPGNGQELERRRRHAIRLLKTGKKLSAVASALSASVSSVFRWWQVYQKKGVSGLRPQAVSGRPPRLSPAQQERLLGMLVEGPLPAGYSTDLWTLQRISRIIRRHFGVTYHRCHVWKLLTSLGLSCQKPERRALQRNEEAIARWKRQKWPRIKKSPNAGSPPRLPRRKWVLAHP